jgi:hypothetical protein
MKHHITIEQFNELSPAAKERARVIIKKQIGSIHFAELNSTDPEIKKYNGLYTGVVTSVENNQYSINFQMKTTGAFQYMIGEDDYPLFSIGELIEILKNENLEFHTIEIDALWNQVKEILER